MERTGSEETARPRSEPARRVPSLDDLRWDGRRALVRVDVNSPIEDGRIAGRARLVEAARSIEALVDRGAGVVVLAHQGRPGRDDFTSLEPHAEILEEVLAREVRFTPHVADDQALHDVQRVAPGDVLVLDNVRGVESEMENRPPEEHAEQAWVRRLAGEADAFVLDAFPAAHRRHASVVGFPWLLPSCAGPLFQEELDALDRFTGDAAGSHRVLAIGGAKTRDALDVIEHHLTEDLADEVLTGGLVGELLLAARDVILGDPTDTVLEEAGAYERLGQAERLLDDHGERIQVPTDVVVGGEVPTTVTVDELPAEETILDIGPATVETYAASIQEADAVVLNGPMGAYEEEGFEEGTRGVLDAMTRCRGFTLVGGGHTVTAMERLGFEDDAFGHVSLAGGALVTYLLGEPLPGLESLAESARRFAIAPRS